MTILTGNLQSVSGTPFGGPGHFVVIYSRTTRPGFSADALILELQDRIPMTTTSGGSFQTEDLDPGPIRVELEGGTVHGRGWDIDLPETGTHSLANLIDAQVEWSPAVVGRAEFAATEAAQAAVRAEAAAVLLESSLANAADVLRVEIASDADRAVSARQGAEAARDAALTAQTGAETAAAGAAADVHTELAGLSESAHTAASAAEDSATAAAGSASAAEVSATSAAASAGAAASAATEAAGQVSVAQAAATSAGEDASAAAISATTAQEAETAASGSAAQADASAVTATTQADRSKTEADRAEAAAQSASTGVQPDTVGRLHLTPALRGEIDGKAEAGHTHLWEDVTGKPDAFPPTDHTHTWHDVSAKPTSFPPSVHSHVAADVDGLQVALDAKADVVHSHTVSQVDGLQAQLDGKASSGHSHTVAQVSGLQDELDGKAAVSHDHTIAQVTGLEDALATAGGPPVVVSTTPPEDTDAIWVNPDEVPPPTGGGTAEQDTGWRSIAGTVKLWPTDTWDAANDTLWIRRVGNTVHLMHERSTDIGANSWGVGDPIPVGFRPAVDTGLIVHGRDNNTGGYLLRTSGMTVWTGPVISAAYFMAPVQSWLTTDPWPTTLPGTAVEGV